MSLNPLRKLEFQDTPTAFQANLKQIKQRWDALMGHISTAVASSTAVTQNSTDISGLQSEIAIIQAEIAALQASTTQRTFPFFAG